MKKGLFLFAGIVCMVAYLITLSCSNNGDELRAQGDSREATFVNPYDYVGVLHNAAMDSVIHQQVNFNELETFTNEYIENNFKGITTFENNDIPNQMMKEIKRTSLMYKYQTRSISEIDDSIMKILPEECKTYICRMYELIDENLSDTIVINKEFNKLDCSVNNDTMLTDEEKNCLLAVSAIAKYSYNYNLDAASMSAVSVNSTVKADLGGAIGGIFCWATFGKAAFNGLVFGPGGAVATIAKEAARGAIVGSAVHVVSGGVF